MQKFLLVVAATLLASFGNLWADETGSLVGQTYTGQTTEVPDGTTWLYAGTSPGVYSALVGNYTVNMSNVYYQISTFVDWMDGKVLVVNQDNTIVYEGALTLTPTGGRSFTEFGVNIPEESKITTPGTYRIIYPTSSGWNAPNDAYITPREKETIYNMVAGPYVVGEIKDPVAAQVTVEPQGNYDTDNSPEYATITVANAWIFNCEDIDNVITVKDSQGTALVMEPGEKSGKTLKWEFPYDAATGKAAVLPKGDYTITVNYKALSAYTEDLNPLEFPAETVDYSFTIEGGVAKVTPQVTIDPLPGHYDSWTASGITILFNKDYQIKNQAEARAVVLTVVNPEGEAKDYTFARNSTTRLGYQPDMSLDGDYKMILKLDGLAGVDIATKNEEVVLQNITFQYSIGNPPVDAAYSVSPTENASLTTDDIKEVTLTITNAASISIAEGTESLINVIDNATQATVDMQAPTVEGNKITWKFPEEWDKAAGSYTIAIHLAEGVAGTTADGNPIKFPDNIEYTITLTEPIVYESVTPKITFTPAGGNYSNWTATSIACKWETTYKLTREGRDMLLGRPITIQKPDGTTLEIVFEKSTDKNIGRINFLQIDIYNIKDVFSEPGTYTVTFPIKGFVGTYANDATKMVEFAENASVQYVILPKKVDAAYTLAPANETTFKAGEEVPAIELTVSNAVSISIAENASAISVVDANNAAVEMASPAVDGNVITWAFPEDWNKAAGNYTISINTADIKAVGENKAEIVFPASIESSFSIEAPAAVPVELAEISATPESGSVVGEWTAAEIVVSWAKSGIALDEASIEELKGRAVTITKAVSEQDAPALQAESSLSIASATATGLTIAVDKAAFAEDGSYTLTVPTAGLKGTMDAALVEISNNVELTYKVDVTLGINGIHAEGAETYYDLKGLRVAHPAPGAAYIKVDAQGKTTKVYVK